MTREEYVRGQMYAETLALMGRMVPAAEMLEHISRTEAIAPIAHPTLYRAGMERLEIVKRYLEATARWQIAARSFLERWDETGPAAARAREALGRDAAQCPAAAAESGEEAKTD